MGPLPVSICVVGPGLVGGALVRQVTSQAGRLSELLKASVKVVALANSKKMLFAPEGVPSDWKADLAKGLPVNIKELGRSVQVANSTGCCIVVDCTAGEDVPGSYVELASQGIHIVTPNKKFGAGPMDRVKALKAAAQSSGSQLMVEATVGAGLPVISTLRSLVETGDKIIRVEGILSGTLSYIFNTYRSGTAFSDVVAGAKAKGYTEPDPREDLSGSDVARKVVILARECGLEVEMSQLKVESLVPEPLAALASGEEYMAQLHKYDGEIGQRAAAAEAEGKVIRYIGRVDVEAGTCSVELTSVGKDHPFAQLSGTDNMVVFTTERYKETPLVIQGPGAGAEVTAAGIFSDIIQIIRAHKAGV